VDAAVTGLAGVAIGTALGGTGKYFSLRRDAWREARTSGLLLLADVQALRDVDATDEFVAHSRLGTKSWRAQCQTLASFRRGSYPSGFRAPEWLTLAGHFAQLERLDAARVAKEGDWWSSAQTELAGAEKLLAHFANDPPVLTYVLEAPWRAVRRRSAGGESPRHGP
jgi:hypothetical protein